MEDKSCDRGEIGALHLAMEDHRIQQNMNLLQEMMPHELLPHQKEFAEGVMRGGTIVMVNVKR